MKLELNYAKLNGVYQVQPCESLLNVELTSHAKTIHSRNERPFQSLVNVEGKQTLAVIHPKFI